MLAPFALAATVLANPSEAEPARVADPPQALVVSGGGALGSYMAGNLFLMDQLRAPDHPPPDVFAGASAGAILSFTAMLEACRTDRPQVPQNPRESLLWQSFVPMGLEVLSPDEPTSAGVFSKRYYRECCDTETDPTCPASCFLAAVRDAWERFGACDRVRFGAPITRVRPQVVDLRLPRVLEHVLVEIQPDPSGPRVVQLPFSTVRLPFETEPGFELLNDVISASSSFPVAFPTQHLPICERCDDCTTCEEPAEVEFTDGGVYDNLPLGLAVEALAASSADAETPHIYIVLPGVYAPEPTEARPHRRALTEFFTIAGAQVGAARTREFVRAFEVLDQATKDRIVVSFSDLKPTSDTFSGFFDPGFREFDFYLGAWQAQRTLRERNAAYSALDGEYDDALDTLESKIVAQGHPSWTPYLCLREALDDAAWERGPHCGLFFGARPGFCALLRATLDRSPGFPDDKPVEGCPYREPRAAPARESDLDALFRVLEAYDYRYETLDAVGGQVRRRASYRVGELVDQYTRLFGGQPEVPALGRVGISSVFGYHPPRHSFYAVGGASLEAGYSFAIPHHEWDWLRLGAAIEFDGLRALGDREWVFLSPQLGAEFELVRSGVAAAQLRVGVRLAYLGRLDTTEPCTRSPEAPCPGFAGKAYVAVGLLGLGRVQVSLLGQRAARRSWFATLRPTLGLQYELR